MEHKFDVEKISYMNPVSCKSAVHEETAEVIVPDSLPDVARILFAGGTAFLRGKEAAENGVSLTGVVEGAVIYVPENEDGVRRLEITVPFSALTDASGLDGESLLTAGISLCGISASAINPRKLSVRAEILTETSGFTPCELELFNTAENGEAELLKKTFAADLPVAVCEKTFTVSDELAIPSSKPDVGEIASVSAVICSDEVKGVGSKVIVRGRVITDILFIPRNGGPLDSLKFTTPFSQIVELDKNCEDNLNDLTLALTGAYVSNGMPTQSGDGTLELEVHAVAQCVSYMPTDMEYVADAYSTRGKIECEYKKVVLPCAGGRFSVTKTVTENAEMPARPREIIDVLVRPGAAGVSDGEVSADAEVLVIYVSAEGELCTVKRTVRASAEFDAGGRNGRVFAAWEGEAFANITGQGIEIRFPVCFTVFTESQTSFDMITAISYDEENMIDTSGLPSLTVYRTREGDDMWLLGKRYLSTEELIRSVNELESGAELVPGQMLIIPRKR